MQNQASNREAMQLLANGDTVGAQQIILAELAKEMNMQPTNTPQFRVHAPGTTTEAPQTPSVSSTHAEGTATIKQDENVCIVQHGLGTAPNTIKLTGIDEVKYFSYIVEVDSKQFQVNLHVPAEQDISFTWTADI